MKAYKISKTLKYLSDPHFQNPHVKIYKTNFYLTAISPLFTAVGSGEECAWLQSATVATVRYGVQHLTPVAIDYGSIPFNFTYLLQRVLLIRFFIDKGRNDEIVH